MQKRVVAGMVSLAVLNFAAIVLIVRLAPREEFLLWYAEKDILFLGAVVLFGKRARLPHYVELLLYACPGLFLLH